MKIVLCSTHFPHCSEMLRKHLPDDTIIACPAEEVPDATRDADVVVPTMHRVDAAIIRATSASMIHQFGVGLEGVDIPVATEQGIYVANVPGHEGAGNAASVSEHAIFLMLALARKFSQAAENVQKNIFGAPMGKGLLDKTVAIIGVGSIGTELASRLRHFGVRLIGLKQHPAEHIKEEFGFDFLGGPQDLGYVLAEADFVVLALPVTPHTRGLIDAQALSSMKNKAYLINVGRGPVIDHDALVAALEREEIAGAGLDVFWDEPTDPTDPLFQNNVHTVIATPHIAGVTDLSYNDIARGLAANVNRLRAGEPPINCVNLAAVQAK